MPGRSAGKRTGGECCVWAWTESLRMIRRRWWRSSTGRPLSPQPLGMRRGRVELIRSLEQFVLPGFGFRPRPGDDRGDLPFRHRLEGSYGFERLIQIPHVLASIDADRNGLVQDEMQSLDRVYARFLHEDSTPKRLHTENAELLVHSDGKHALA